MKPQVPGGYGSSATFTGKAVSAPALGRAAVQPSHAEYPLLRLQRQYGNRYVQRVMAQGKKAGDKGEPTPDLERTIERARGGGQALDSEVRAQMEPAFGTDFIGVRVHADVQADTLNRSLNARAFTTGQDIFFKQGEYTPGSSGGLELLAHELTHVIQQSGDGMRCKLTVGAPGDIHEQEADSVARTIVQQKQQLVQEESGVQLRRQPVPEEQEEERMQSKREFTHPASPPTAVTHQRSAINRSASQVFHTRQQTPYSALSQNARPVQTLQRANAEAGESSYVGYDVPLIPQTSSMSCWAASAAMLVSWRDAISIDDRVIAAGIGYWSEYLGGLDPEDVHMFAGWGLVEEEPQTFTIEAFKGLLETYGPLWVAADANSAAGVAPHVRVVTGLYGDGTPDGTFLSINDPAGPTTVVESYATFVSAQEELAISESQQFRRPIYVAHNR